MLVWTALLGLLYFAAGQIPEKPWKPISRPLLLLRAHPVWTYVIITALIGLPVQYVMDRRAAADSAKKEVHISELLQQGQDHKVQMTALQDEANRLKSGKLQPPTGVPSELLKVTVGGITWSTISAIMDGWNFVARRSKVDGTILISSTFYSSSGKVVATIYNNEFELNNANFELQKPDSSTLIVKGPGTHATCRIDPPDTVNISGMFFIKGGVPIKAFAGRTIVGTTVFVDNEIRIGGAAP